MKNRIYTMKGMLATLLGAFLLGYAVTGCIDEKDHYKPDDKTSGVPNSFDFATTQDVQLDLKYDVPVKDYRFCLNSILKIRCRQMPKGRW